MVRNLAWVFVFVAACGGYAPVHWNTDGGVAVVHHDLAIAKHVGDDGSSAQPVVDLSTTSDSTTDAGSGSDAGPIACQTPCAAGSYCNDGACAALPTQCPCPLGSYCDLTDMTCKGGCRTNDHCPRGTICDTRHYVCAPKCSSDSECGHYSCVDTSTYSKGFCGSCDSTKCECNAAFADCNKQVSDGCETDLNTVANCGSCGKAGVAVCYPDKDGDGYGVAGPSMIACQCGAGWAQANAMGTFDCNDDDVNTHPNGNFGMVPDSRGSFDYNCDGVEEPYPIDLYGSYDGPADCHQFYQCAFTITMGYSGCGKPFTYTVCSEDDQLVCSIDPQTPTEACR